MRGMSHFTTLRTKITDVQALVAALNDVGQPRVHVYDEPRHLRGFLGDVRPQTAEVIIAKEDIGPASNDIGFKQQPDGSFTAIVSEFDRSRYSLAWLHRLTQRHAYHLSKRKLEEQGFELVTEEAQPDGVLRLSLRRLA